MNPLLWFVTWVLVSLLPVSHIFLKSKARHILLGCFGMLFGLLTIVTGTVDTHHIWVLVAFKLIASLAEWFFACDMSHSSRRSYRRRARRRLTWDEEEPEEEAEKPVRFDINPKKLYKYLIVLGFIVLIFGSGLLLYQMGLIKGVANAGRFDQMIEYMPKGTALFESEIANDMLRLTTDELARSIVQRNIAHFGSDVEILSNHITIYNGRLVWIASIGRARWSDNQVKGFVIIDANNPEVEPEIVDMKFGVGEGLICFPPFHYGGIQGNAYFSVSTANIYGRAYLTPNPEGEWKYVMTVYTLNQWDFVERPNGVLVYGKHGHLEEHYSMDEIPMWITQPFDEGWLEGQVDMWGSHKRGDGFDIWAGGLPWIPPSNDRVSMSEDTRFIVSPDTNNIVAMVNVDPIGPIETIAGSFKFSHDGIQYYDLTQYNIQSGHQAENVIESHILKPTTGEYQARMPLLYPINDTYAWFVPIYWEGDSQGSGHDTIRLAGLGIVEANDLDHLSIVMTSEGFKGASLVAEAKQRFLGEQPTEPEPDTETEVVNGTLTEKLSYTLDGNTVYILTVNATDYVAYTNRFDFHVTAIIERLEVGSHISIEVNKANEFICFTD